MPVWVSLLRGVNLGARNQVNMPKLRIALEEAGFEAVRTYVQSGNVVTKSRHRNPKKVADEVRSVVADTFGVDVPVVVRSPAELRALLDWNPFPDDTAARPTAVHLIHLVGDPPADQVEALTATDYSPDELVVRGREVALCYAETSQRRRLQPAALLKRLGVDGTARNWRTLQALVELTSWP